MLVYSFPELSTGKLVKRYKRFFADIELENGEIVTAHCANTGPMTGICTPGATVYVSHSNNPKRKLKYSWELIEVDQTIVGVNTSLPNKVIGAMLEQRLLEPLEPYTSFKGEVKYGQENSRIDFLLTSEVAQTYVEIKNTTWAKGNLALFPDTVTTRGQKHLRELMAVMQEAPEQKEVSGDRPASKTTSARKSTKSGKTKSTKPEQSPKSSLPNLATKAALIYFINRHDCDRFTPGDEADPEYGKLFRAAIDRGVMVLPCRFEISPAGIKYLGLAELVI
ncbi:Sugar fermentation stimulation protein A [Thalassoporum mexicanum PCC 7367]|uniref:DNA/RNA nuclease SfsA n=1 Tax=Thalassoporum mexicanum TaxID=3457544 RepID=UPI00029FD292|nr:DNA/RNA nuclease SfsA [Pseudanabaena sp. PCC 7367]AFY71381.1 Sugar fermentation stimulation protein A [Pseudanabaena sp. PCC 7367]